MIFDILGASDLGCGIGYSHHNRRTWFGFGYENASVFSILSVYSRKMSRVLRPLELTLALIKPDVCRNPHKLQRLREIILENDFYFINTKVTQLSQSEAERFYHEHRERFFFNRLVTFMSSGLISAHVLARENAILHWRALMGPTKVYKAQYEAPQSIRAQFGLTDTRNATHGSDSEDSARREISFFFPSFSIEEWYKTQEPLFRNNCVIFDSERWIHRVKDVPSEIPSFKITEAPGEKLIEVQ